MPAMLNSGRTFAVRALSAAVVLFSRRCMRTTGLETALLGAAVAANKRAVEVDARGTESVSLANIVIVVAVV